MARDLMITNVTNVTREMIKVRMATVDEYAIPPEVTEACKKAPRSEEKKPGKFTLSGKREGYTPPPMPKKE